MEKDSKINLSQAPSKKRLLMIGTDRLLFDENSEVRKRQIEYAKNWDEVHIIVAADKSYKEAFLGNNVWVYPSGYSFKLFYPLSIIRLGRFIISRRNISNITCQDPFFTAMAAISLKKQFNLPLEIQVHTDMGSPNFTYTLGNRIRKSLALSYLPQADSIRVVSNKIKDFLVNMLNISESKITVQPIRVDTDQIRSMPITVNLREKYPEFNKIALMASRLEKEKNIEMALKAWVKVVEKSPKAGLIIVGEGSRKEGLMRLAKGLGIEKNVVFESWADRTTVVSYYKTSDIFINTSMYEGYGMSIVEALIAGVKVISTDVGVAREMGAVIVDANIESLSQAINL